MGDGRKRDADAENGSWTDLEEVRADRVEVTPIRHGMVLAGRYAVEQIIGRGGSGVVVRAHDRDLRQEVAIKIVRAELVGQHVWATRLAREVKLARQIHHPHVCRVFDFEQAEGRAFLVMELAEKGSLRDELRSGALAARSLDERIADARAVASALAAIHAAGIVHRDLSPQNLLRMGDGRLVVSDFGLATDASESTSIHGGTVAYMAPEVMLGGKASVASDIWALGVVMHEMVFGVKPRWSSADAAEMLAPELRRKPTEEERRVIEACRACTVKAPARRVANTELAGRLLTQPRRWWSRVRARVRRRTVVAACALWVAAVSVIAVVRSHGNLPGVRTSTQSSEAPLIAPTGEAADWTDISTVLLEVPGRIKCTRVLPDRRTIRFVWGTPTHAEEIDILTRKRVASSLVPAAYAEGCPDLSPDGKRLVYQGHAADGRAFAFLSQHPDGRAAVPVVPTAEPTMSSEPTWLGNGEAFSYDVDTRHVGLYAPAVGHTYVIAEAPDSPFVTAFRFVVGSQIFVETALESGETELVGISAPTLLIGKAFRLPDLALDLTAGGPFLYYATAAPTSKAQLVELDLARGRSHWLGGMRGQFLRYPMLFPAGLAFESVREESHVLVRGREGAWKSLLTKEGVTAVRRCGQDFIVSEQEVGRTTIKRIDDSGRLIRVLLESGAGDFSGACSVDGQVWYYSHFGSPASIRRCDASECRDFYQGAGGFLTPSPDGTKLGFVVLEKRGPVIYWSSVDGGSAHEVCESETGCGPGWTSADTMWVSRRRAGKIVWVEINIHSRLETGTTVPGTRDCSDGHPDPASPVDPDLRIVIEETSQLRLLDRRHLPPETASNLGKLSETR